MKRNASRLHLIAATLLMSGVVAHPAAAAPFCISSQVLPPQCIYVDAEECGREATRQGAVCSANAAELRLTRGVGQYCAVTSTQISICHYADRQSCNVDAARLHGTCVAALGVAPARTPDPYSAINGQ
jgi:hypothetical protein